MTLFNDSKARLSFEQGTLLIQGQCPLNLDAVDGVKWDERTLQWRAPGHLYRELMLKAKAQNIELIDEARCYEKLPLELKKDLIPRPHQAEALKNWLAAGGRGVVSLPTGAGKTILAVMAIAKIQRPTFVIVPTIDLLHQWTEVLKTFFEVPIGALGGGSREILPITVSTYDSAVIFMEQMGSRFGFLVVDECHHLPAPQYQSIAVGMIAPFRLGLSATVERTDGKEEEIFRLLGSLVFEARIDHMIEKVLAPYDVVNIEVDLTEEERLGYLAAREIYTAFIRKNRIAMNSPDGWMQFVMLSARTPEGKKAMTAYREQKRLSQAATGKLSVLWDILLKHSDEQMIVFTHDNDLAYRIGRDFVLPVLTHQTKLAERKRMLEAFRSGAVKVLVTSKVLNEGVDVPEASIGVVLSGSAAVREHVQRLGRILRHKPGKKATLYEIVAKGTSEYFVNQRRKQHHAYQRPAEVSH